MNCFLPGSFVLQKSRQCIGSPIFPPINPLIRSRIRALGIGDSAMDKIAVSERRSSHWIVTKNAKCGIMELILWCV